MRHFFLIASLFCVGSLYCFGQTTITLPYSNMDSWITREITESFIIGGQSKQLYEIGQTKHVKNIAAHVAGDSPWETSSVYANVLGIVKGSSTVFPERRGDGYCARLETVMEEVSVFGIINLDVLATGTILTGRIVEPVEDSDNPQQKLLQGIPFTERISALKFDYKVKTGGKRIMATGFSTEKLQGINAADVCVLLQKRWEDSDGNIYAKRVGTGWVRFGKSTAEWVNGYTLPIRYGDITKRADYKSFEKLYSNPETAIYGRNSRGEAKPIIETGWASADETPTHLIVRFSAGYGGAYVGAIGDILWVDNVELLD